MYDKLSNMVDHDECMYSISQKRNLHHMIGVCFLNHKLKDSGAELGG